MGDNSNYSNSQLRCPSNSAQTYVGLDAPSANCSACFLKRRAHIGPDNLEPDSSSALAKGFGSVPKKTESGAVASRLLCPGKDTLYVHHVILASLVT
jgi:hypothetical protein